MKCPTVSNFLGCIELRLANIGIGIFFVVIVLLVFLFGCLAESLNGAEVRLMAIPFCIVLTIRGYWFYGVCNKSAAPMVPQLVYTIFEIVGLLSVPFLLAGGYNTNYAKLRRGYYSSMTEEIAHKWSVISFIAYVAAIVLSYLWIVQYSYYKLVKDTATVRNEDRKFGFSAITA